MNKYLKLTIATILSFTGIYIAFLDTNIENLFNEFKNVNYLGLIISTLLLIFSCLIRAYRWQILINPLENISINKIFSSTMIGYFGNGLLAFRLGELLKAYSVSKNSKIDTAQAFGTVIIERFLDLLMVLLLFIVVIPWFPFDNKAIKLGIMTFGIATLVISIALFLFLKINLLSFNSFNKDSNSKILNFFFKIVKNIYNSFKIMQNTDNKLKLIFYSLFLWSIYILITKIILISCDIELNSPETIILFIIGSLSLGIPALPGSAGTYDASVKYGLMAIFLIESNKALTYAIISHAISYFPLVIIGAFYFFRNTYTLKDLKPIKS